MWRLLSWFTLSSDWRHRHTDRFSLLQTVSPHTMKRWLKHKLLLSLSLSLFFLPQMLEHTCKLVDSHLRSKEANIRLSQLSWAWFRRKCKQLYNSNLIMSPSIYKGGSRRTDSVHTESSESGNIKHINEKLWKPVPSGCGALAPSCSSRGYA